MPWLNSINNNSGRSPPIMVIMDNTSHSSPSVHSSTPIIITPSQSDTNLSNIINKQNNSINDEHESEVDDEDDELDDDIDDTPLLKSPNNN